VLQRLPPDRSSSTTQTRWPQEDLAISHRFVTLFYSRFRSTHRVLRYANAGPHPTTDLSVFFPRGQRVERLDAPALLDRLQLEADYGCQAGGARTRSMSSSITPMGSVKPAAGRGDAFDEDRLIQWPAIRQPVRLPAQGILDRLFAPPGSLSSALGQPLDERASMVVLKCATKVRLPLPARLMRQAEPGPQLELEEGNFPQRGRA